VTGPSLLEPHVVLDADGDFWSRPGLDLCQRELVTVAALCALGRERQLAGHLRSARDAGVPREQLVEVIMQMAIYAGWPAAVNGLLVARDVLAAEPTGAHVHHVGATRVTVVSDGHADLPAAMFAGGIGPAAVQQLLQRHSLASDPVRLSLNGLVLEHGGRLIVVDPGSGPADSPHAHGLVTATMGQFMTNFRRAGFDPDLVDLVILTHAHHDHAGGVLSADGGLAFPNARVAISEPELVHWRDVGDYGEATVPDALAAGGRALGVALTAAIAERVDWLVDEQEVVPGLRALAAPGHSCGHTALLLEDGGEALLLGGDFATHEIVQLAAPASHMVVDFDSTQAIASRRRMLRRASAAGHPVHAFHFAFPGIGHVSAREDGWAFDPLDGCG